MTVTTVLIDDKTELQPALDDHKFESDLKIMGNYVGGSGAKKVYQRGLGVETFYSYDDKGYPLLHTDTTGKEYRYLFHKGNMIYRSFSHQPNIFFWTYKFNYKFNSAENSWYRQPRGTFKDWKKVSPREAERDIKNNPWRTFNKIKNSIHSEIISNLENYFKEEWKK